MRPDEFQSVKLSKYVSPIPGIRVLVVDGDSACLTDVSKMLCTLGYEVVTATLASDALLILQEKKNEIHLVLMESHLPDVERFVLIEKIRETFNLPFLIMSADDRVNSMFGALYKGAQRYIIKPVMIADLMGLWQSAIRNRKNGIIDREEVRLCQGDPSEGNISDRDIECQSFMNTGEQSLPSAKRKEPKLLDIDEERENIESLVLKEQKLTWTDDSHKRFLEAIGILEINGTGSKNIFQHMNVPGITKEQISSYLQTNNFQERSISLGQQRLTYQPGHSSNYQRDLSSGMFASFLGPANFPSQEISSGEDSSSRQNQLILPHNLQGVVTHSTPSLGEFKVNGNEEAFAGFDRGENATGGDTFPLHMDYTGGGNGMHSSTQLASDMHQQFAPQPLLPVPALSTEEKEQDIMEAEEGKIDRLWDIPNGTQQFNDMDLDEWLSTFSSRS